MAAPRKKPSRKTLVRHKAKRKEPEQTERKEPEPMDRRKFEVKLAHGAIMVIEGTHFDIYTKSGAGTLYAFMTVFDGKRKVWMANVEDVTHIQEAGQAVAKKGRAVNTPRMQLVQLEG
jgi:hypothetical protein